MSFILDALKKSEGDRQRQTGPSFFEVKVATPRPRLPPWAIALGALLLVNLGVVAWLALRESPDRVAQQQPLATPASTARVNEQAPPPPAAAPAAPPLDRSPEPLAEENSTAEEATASEPELFDEEDYAPAVAEAPASPGRVTRGTILGVPTYDQLAGTRGASLPELRLDLHVFANEPADRFIFLNNKRLREGEALPDGTRVESIVPDGAVLAVRGMRFLLQRQ